MRSDGAVVIAFVVAMCMHAGPGWTEADPCKVSQAGTIDPCIDK